MTETRNYVAILPNKAESFHELRWDLNNSRWNDGAIRNIAEEAVRKAGLTTDRKNPGSVRVEVRRLTIKGGGIERGAVTTFDITPPLKPMTADEFNDEMLATLAELPQEFADFVKQKAWEDGHANGYEEVVAIAGNMVTDLKPVVEAYTKRIKAKK